MVLETGSKIVRGIQFDIYQAKVLNDISAFAPSDFAYLAKDAFDLVSTHIARCIFKVGLVDLYWCGATCDEDIFSFRVQASKIAFVENKMCTLEARPFDRTLIVPWFMMLGDW